MKPAAMMAMLLLSACAGLPSNDYWARAVDRAPYPDEQIKVFYVTVPEAYCPVPSDGGVLYGCASYAPEACNIYIRESLRWDGCLLSHERKHCKGFEHPRNPHYDNNC